MQNNNENNNEMKIDSEEKIHDKISSDNIKTTFIDKNNNNIKHELIDHFSFLKFKA